jgi:hypothetical protein
MEIINQYTVNFPSWALSAIYHGDYSGIESDEDCKQVEAWEKENPGFYCVLTGPSFVHKPEFGLACDCVELQVTEAKGKL